MVKRFLTASVFALVLTAPVYSQTFEETLAMAHGSNPTLQGERARVRAVEEGVVQARASIFPQLSLSASHSESRTEGGTGSFGNLSTSGQQVGVNVSQAIYQGGRIRGSIDAAQANALAAGENLRAVEQSVLIDAATAFLDVRRDAAIVEIRRNNVDVLQHQLDAARDRFEVGEITRTDVAQAESRLSAARAQFVASQAQLAASRSAYERVVGQAPATLPPPPPPPATPDSLDSAHGLALDFAPALRAAALNEQAAAANIRVARGAVLPTVSLGGSATTAGDTVFDSDASQRYSVSAQVSVPLFTGGLNRSRIRQAAHTADQVRTQTLTAHRTTREAVSNAWNGLIATRSVIESSREAVRASEIALDGVQQEAFVGLRTTLDVLNAEQELLNARLALVNAERDAYVAALRLRQAMGLLTLDELGLTRGPGQ